MTLNALKTFTLFCLLAILASGSAKADPASPPIGDARMQSQAPVKPALKNVNVWQTMAAQEKARYDADTARYEAILSKAERQQAEYQQYLDSRKYKPAGNQ